MENFDVKKLIEALRKDEDKQKDVLRDLHIEQGYGQKAINSPEDGKNLYASLWSMETFGDMPAEFWTDSHPHMQDENVRLFYVWADSLDHAIEILDDGNGSFTGEVNDTGEVYIEYFGENF
nr:hypothetical protein [Paenibacillus bovis]